MQESENHVHRVTDAERHAIAQEKTDEALNSVAVPNGFYFTLNPQKDAGQTIEAGLAAMRELLAAQRGNVVIEVRVLKFQAA